MAACRDNVETAAFLVDKGADVNIGDEYGVSTSIDNIPMEKGLEMCEYFFQVTWSPGKRAPPMYTYV